MKKFIKYHCDNKDWYENQALLDWINNRCNLAQQQGLKVVDSIGEMDAVSLFDTALIPQFVKLAPDLWKFIEHKKDHAVKYFFNKKPKKIKLHRFWFNRMKKDSQIKVHCHYSNQFDIVVGIFYLQTKPDSGVFTLVDLNLSWEESSKYPLDNYPDEIKTPVTVNSGELLMHHGKVAHGVSPWLENEPRICLVFEYQMIWE